MRTIVWFVYFWLYLVGALPAMFRANRLLKEGRLQERDQLVQQKVRSWADHLLRLAGVKEMCIRDSFWSSRWLRSTFPLWRGV